MTTDEAGLREAAAALQRATRIVVLTGAGMSAPSGVPTFRGTGGLWRSFKAQDLATPAAFARDPETVWAWYDWRRQQIAQCLPNAGHEVLARWSQHVAHVRVITQNVDGLHERAGTHDLLRLHGSIWRARCTRRCPQGAPHDLHDVPLAVVPPRCACGALLRPDVVWFGEALDPRLIAAAHEEVSRADVFLTIGTSAQVHPAAGLVPLAHASGAVVIEINPEPAADDGSVDIRLARGADEALADLDVCLRN